MRYLTADPLCTVLVSAGNNKFTYAGIFCGLTAFIGTTIAISPRIWEIALGLRDRSRDRRKRSSLAKSEVQWKK